MKETPLQEATRKFHSDGFAVIADFVSAEELAELRAEMQKIISEMDPKDHPATVFSTVDEDKHVKDSYFLDSADKISFFYEDGAIDEKGNLKVDKTVAFNKVGHALHTLNPVFKRITSSEKFQKVVRAIGYSDPKIVQSMYIFKQPRIGGTVGEHFDATFLYVEPIQNLLGMWIPIDDATTENGCLHFIPGSHKVREVNYRFERTGADIGPLVGFTGTKATHPTAAYVPVPVTKGSLVLIHGLVWHKSQANLSEKPRHAYTFHVVDMKDTEWSPNNWFLRKRLQPASGDFLPLYS